MFESKNDNIINTISDFESFLLRDKRSFIPRGELIDLIITINEDFSYILRAFLICSNERIIDKLYLLEKVRYIKNREDNPTFWMAYVRVNIYKELKSYLGKRIEVDG